MNNNIRLEDMDENVPVPLFGLLGAVILAVTVVLLRLCISKCLTNKKRQSSNQPLPVTSTLNSQIRSSSISTQSDHQIVFDRMPRPLPLRHTPRLNATASATQIVQEIEDQLYFDNMRIEYERRAQERRDALGIFNNSIHMPPRPETNTGVRNEQPTEIYLNPPTIETFENSFSYWNPAPRYISQDDELPSYEAATATANNNR